MSILLHVQVYRLNLANEPRSCGWSLVATDQETDRDQVIAEGEQSCPGEAWDAAWRELERLEAALD